MRTSITRSDTGSATAPPRSGARADPGAEWPPRRSPAIRLRVSHPDSRSVQCGQRGREVNRRPFGGLVWKLRCPGAGRQALLISALSCTLLTSVFCGRGSPSAGCARGVFCVAVGLVPTRRVCRRRRCSFVNPPWPAPVLPLAVCTRLAVSLPPPPAHLCFISSPRYPPSLPPRRRALPSPPL